MGQIIHYLGRMLPAAALALGGYLAAYGFRKGRLAGRGYRSGPVREGILLLFLMFLAGLLWLTVLPEILWEDGRILLREEGLGEINLRPFLIFKQSRILAQQGVKSYFLINFWGNILMFVPIGFFPGLLWRDGRWWKAGLTGLGLSLTIELCQIPIHRGTDIDDLWLNTLGALLGYGLLALAQRLAPGFTRLCKLEEGYDGR